MFKLLFTFSLVFFFTQIVQIQSASAMPWNMHLIDSNPATGFEIYRSSSPTAADVKEWCAMGIQEVYVLSGDAGSHELQFQTECPTLKVVYNETQRAKTPLDTAFLTGFDQWVTNAQAQGKKILFRCSCGCHRTGRLAAYYRMRYNGFDAEQAVAELKDRAKWMFFYPFLVPQVYALNDFIKGAECSEKYKYCVWTRPEEDSFAGNR